MPTLLGEDDNPVRMNGTVGMGHRAKVRDIYNEAMTMAKESRKNGDYGVSYKMAYGNDKYEVWFELRVTGKDDGGGRYYEGKMEVQSKEGSSTTQDVKGYCGC